MGVFRSMTQGKPGKLHYGWIVAGVTFAALLVSAGVRSLPGVLMLPLENEFGWERSGISVAVSINLVLYGLMGPFAAACMERFGIRAMMTTALGCLRSVSRSLPLRMRYGS